MTERATVLSRALFLHMEQLHTAVSFVLVADGEGIEPS